MKSSLATSPSSKARLLKRLITYSFLALVISLLCLVPTARALAPEAPAVPAPVAPVVAPAPDTKALWIERLSDCENPSNDPTNTILDVNGKYSYGDLKFQMGTWLAYHALGASTTNVLDPVLQRKVARYMLDHGGWRNWYNCGLKLRTKIGPYPVDA